MTWRIVDITEPGRYLHTERKSLVVLDNKQELGRIPLRDIQAIITHSYYGTYSHGLLFKLAECNIPLVVCNEKHLPVALLVPTANHYLQSGRIQAQASVAKPIKKKDLERASKGKN